MINYLNKYVEITWIQMNKKHTTTLTVEEKEYKEKTYILWNTFSKAIKGNCTNFSK